MNYKIDDQVFILVDAARQRGEIVNIIDGAIAVVECPQLGVRHRFLDAIWPVPPLELLGECADESRLAPD